MKKGFVSTAVVYTFLIIFLLLMSTILVSYINRTNYTSKLSQETKDYLNGAALFTIQIDVPNGTSAPLSNTTDSNGSSEFVITPNTGYTLIGASVSCEQAASSIDASTGALIVSDVTQDQTCTVTLKQSYIVTFNVNGGSTWTSSTCTSPSTLSSTTCTKTVVHGETYGTLPTPTRSHYVFTGWYTSSSGGTNITESTTVSLSANQTLYAQWAAGRTVTMNVTGGTSSPASITVARGSSAEFTITPSAGYTLTGATVICKGTAANIDETTGIVTISNITVNETCTATLRSESVTTYTITYTGFSSTLLAPSSIDSGSSVSATATCTQKITCYNATCSSSKFFGNNYLITISNPTGDVYVTCSSGQDEIM